MLIRFTKRAHIAFEQLPPNEYRRARLFFDKIENSKTLSDLNHDVKRLRTQAEPGLFIARLSPRYRAILTAERSEVSILEIMDHDRLSRTYGIAGDEL